MRFYITVAALFFGALSLSAQSFTGVWRTVDDETGQAKSNLEIYEAGGKYYGKVAKTLRPDAKTHCEKCPGERKNQPIVGMVLLVNMLLKDGMLQGGDILDPEKGKWYGCKIWFKPNDPNTLIVRGYLGPFYRTQYWTRVN